MSEKSLIEATKKINTVDSIYNGLLKIGVKNGDVLLVHSSLSSLGWVCGAEQALLMALLKSVGEDGTLVMPTQTGYISDPAEWQFPPVPKDWWQDIYENMPAFDINLSKTRGMGCTAELFRTLPETMRSNHPQVSFAAKGKYAKEITSNHPLTPQFGMDSPLGKMYDLNAKVLLLGVDYDSCTSFHLAEALNDKMPRVKMGTAIMENGKRTWKWFEDFDYNSDDDFKELGTEFEKTGNVTIDKIGNAECKLFDIKPAVQFGKEWLEIHRFNS